MSNIDEWLKEVQETNEREEQNREEQYRMTVRLKWSDRALLDEVAKRLKLVRTVCAEQLLSAAIRDASLKLGMSHYEGVTFVHVPGLHGEYVPDEGETE